jgi:mRNA interferase RelE/StbE
MNMRPVPWYIPEEIKVEIRHFPPFLKGQVSEALDVIAGSPKSGKILEEDLTGLRSFRIGKYRLIYKIGSSRLELVAVGPRRDIYERLVLEIGRARIRERRAKYSAKARK